MAKKSLVKINGMTATDAAERLKVSRPHITHLCQTGELDCERVLGRLIIDPKSVTKYAKSPDRRKRSKRVGRPRKK